MLYKWSPAVDVFANYSGSYEPPTFGELTGGPNVTPLSAQKGRTLEVGTRGLLPAVQWDVAYYYTDLDNELLSLNSPRPAARHRQCADTLHQGIEVGLDVTFAERVVWRSSYLWNDFRFRGNPSSATTGCPASRRSSCGSEAAVRPAAGW